MHNNWVAGLAITLLVTGCVSGSVLVTATARAPIDFASVRIYTTPPADFEEIAIVKAASDAGWTQQADVDYALAEPRKQAARLGTSGVLLTSTGTQTGIVGVRVYGGGAVVATTEKQVLEGRAVHVSPE